MPEPAINPPTHQLDISSAAKQYSKTKLILGIISPSSSFLVVVLILLSGFSVTLRDWATSQSTNEYVAVVLFLLAITLIESAVTFPISFYSSYIVEHRYNLSTQTLGRWLWERVKGLLITTPLLVVGVVLLFYCLKEYGEWWWLPVSTVLAFFSVVFARVVPIIIMPLFYKFTPLQDRSLKEAIAKLCNDAGIRFDGIFSFNMSKNTKKANAGFTGIGRSKRIILGDTLLKDFSQEEIETVFAHELGHYRYRHIIVGMAVGILFTFIGLFVTSRLYIWSLPWFGFTTMTDLAALPLLGLWLTIFGLVVSPLSNVLSRKHERDADLYAVRTTRNKPAFISALHKLAETNLADPEPHALIEFLFYSHPSIARRIAMVGSID